MPMLKSPTLNPEEGTAQNQVRHLLEDAIESLAESYRVIVVLREVEELDVAQTAETLGVSKAVVKTRLHRAHAMLRRQLHSPAGRPHYGSLCLPRGPLGPGRERRV